MGSGKHLKKSIKKYGIENFEKEIIKWFDSQEDMYNEEAELVNVEFVNRKDTYNITEGGKGGWEYATKIRNEKYGENWGMIFNKMGIQALQEKYGENWGMIFNKMGTQAIKEKYPEGTWKNKKHTEESKKKIGMSNSIHQKGSGNSQYGKCWIYNSQLKENKSIPKTELQEWLDAGWIKGRKMK